MILQMCFRGYIFPGFVSWGSSYQIYFNFYSDEYMVSYLYSCCAVIICPISSTHFGPEVGKSRKLLKCQFGHILWTLYLRCFSREYVHHQLCHIWGLVFLVGLIEFRRSGGRVYNCYHHHQIGSINLSQCCHIFPLLWVWCGLALYPAIC